MVRANSLNKKFLTFIVLALSMTALAVVAIPINWFEAAKITGVVVKTESSTVKAIINLGNLTSATPFSASGSGTITVAESGGLSMGNFIMGYPIYTPEEGYVYDRYLTARFYRLRINLTIGDKSVIMPIVVDGSVYYWYSEYEEYPWRYCRYPDWLAITLPQGTHTATFTLSGTTAVTTRSSGVEMVFYFALAPP